MEVCPCSSLTHAMPLHTQRKVTGGASIQVRCSWRTSVPDVSTTWCMNLNTPPSPTFTPAWTTLYCLLSLTDGEKENWILCYHQSDVWNILCVCPALCFTLSLVWRWNVFFVVCLCHCSLRCVRVSSNQMTNKRVASETGLALKLMIWFVLWYVGPLGL